MIQRLRGLTPGPLPSVSARLTTDVTSPKGRRSHLRAVLDPEGREGEGGHTVSPAVRQGSHQLSALADADGLLVVPEETTELAAGELVEVLLLPGR